MSWYKKAFSRISDSDKSVGIQIMNKLIEAGIDDWQSIISELLNKGIDKRIFGWLREKFLNFHSQAA